MKIREGTQFFIYALVCPITLEVKYVGQTGDLERRGRAHTKGSVELADAVRYWLKTLGYLKPYRVLLETGINRRVTVKSTIPNVQSTRGGRRPAGVKTVWLSSCLETKWIKRFRRTVLNINIEGSGDVSRLLVNPALPWELGGTHEPQH
jgi:hypothetical protein